SWDQANDRCQGGDIVIVRGGSYGDVKITGSNGRNGPGVCTFQPADSEVVTVRGLDNGNWSSGGGGGNYLTFKGPVTAQSFYADYTSNVTVDGWDIDAGGRAVGVWQPFHV